MNCKEYNTWIFDCDGVILDSNSIKTESFYEVALPYGKSHAEDLVSYHKQFGGVSRFKKFEYFFEDILGRVEYQKEFEEVATHFGEIALKKLLDCPLTEGLISFLEYISNTEHKVVVSGGWQKELRCVFNKRRLDRYFDNIYGCPDSKIEILQRKMNQGSLLLPAIFIGDSKYDYECARKFNIDFVFMHYYSEFDGWKDYFCNKPVSIISNLRELVC